MIWRQSDNKVYDRVAAANTFDTYTDADIATYNVELTNLADSDYHAVTFPADITVGVYYVQIMLQDSAVADTPHADNDEAVAQGVMHWDGAAEIDTTTLDTTIEDDVIGAAGDTLESLSGQLDDVTVDQNKLTNVYDETDA